MKNKLGTMLTWCNVMLNLMLFEQYELLVFASACWGVMDYAQYIAELLRHLCPSDHLANNTFFLDFLSAGVDSQQFGYNVFLKSLTLTLPLSVTFFINTQRPRPGFAS